MTRPHDPGLDVLLAYMPFGILPTPSLALGLLQASLGPLGVTSRQAYFSFEFARRIGVASYQAVSNLSMHSGYHEVGEWIFAEALFGPGTLDAEGYLERVLRHPPPEHGWSLHPVPEELVQIAAGVRRMAGAYMDSCLEMLEELRPRIVGFSTMFQQRNASLALARRIKDRRPETLVVFGGTDCEGVKGAEILRRFPFVDAIATGEGDRIFPELVERALGARPLEGLPGLLVRPAEGTAGTACLESHAPAADLDELPYPLFEDYFDQLATSGVELPIRPYLSLETSRGCWWGMKSHCTFCSINGGRMAFRSKSSARAIEEIGAFAKRYPGLSICMTDSIVDRRYFDELFPLMAECSTGAEIQYEIKPDLRKKDVGNLRKAGITTIQPGIESLSTRILRLMGKGTTALQNVQLLKWCRQRGIRVLWNVLWGFPGETVAEYEGMLRILPLLSHLAPPGDVRQINIGRFSPLFDLSERLGLGKVAPSPAYRYIYPLGEEAIGNLATYFVHEYRPSAELLRAIHALSQAAREWIETYPRSGLFYVDDGSRMEILDLRPVAGRQVVSLEGAERALYLACDGIAHATALARALEGATGARASLEEVHRVLDPIVAGGLALEDGDRYLALAVGAVTHADRRAIRRSIRSWREEEERRRFGERLLACARLIDTDVREREPRRSGP
ncbi:MAG: RiPP maturation radical SAM protein 1 [Planctomycetes bacterium]|nr:RiPP maturation radical SAM protein 1 [Planctomycetota bacterium]